VSDVFSGLILIAGLIIWALIPWWKGSQHDKRSERERRERIAENYRAPVVRKRSDGTFDFVWPNR
jgi:hypothetical protein